MQHILPSGEATTGWRNVWLCMLLLGGIAAVAQEVTAQGQERSRGGSIASASPLEREQESEKKGEEVPPLVLPPALVVQGEEGMQETAPEPAPEDEVSVPVPEEAPDTGTQEIIFETEDALPITQEIPASPVEQVPVIQSAPPAEAAAAARTPVQSPPAPVLGPNGEPTVTNFFYETDIREAVNEMAQQGGKRVIIAPEVEGLVTISFSDVPLGQALRLMLAGTGFILTETEEYFLITSRDIESAGFIELSETQLIRLDYLDAQSARTLLSKPLQDYVAADAERNLLSITAPQSIMNRIIEDLATLDAPPRQMVLETKIVVMETEDLMNLGFQWDWPTATAGTFSNSGLQGRLQPPSGPSWPWGVQLGYTPDLEFTNALNVTLNLLAQNNQLTVVANLQVMALDGEEAEVSVTTEEYFEIISQGFYTQSQLEQVEAGTVMKVTPRVSENGDIKMMLSTEVSDVVARGENDLPVVTRRVSSSSVRVKEGGTVVVAGLSDDRNNLGYQRVPGLGDVPGLSTAFRNTSRDRRTRQIFVFVTPRIIRGDKPGEELRPREQIATVDEDVFREELVQAIAHLKISTAERHAAKAAAAAALEPPIVAAEAPAPAPVVVEPKADAPAPVIIESEAPRVVESETVAPEPLVPVPVAPEVAGPETVAPEPPAPAPVERAAPVRKRRSHRVPEKVERPEPVYPVEIP